MGCRGHYVSVLQWSHFELHGLARNRHKLSQNDSNTKRGQDRRPKAAFGNAIKKKDTCRSNTSSSDRRSIYVFIFFFAIIYLAEEKGRRRIWEAIEERSVPPPQAGLLPLEGLQL
jgi:hypothetical protein